MAIGLFAYFAALCIGCWSSRDFPVLRVSERAGTSWFWVEFLSIALILGSIHQKLWGDFFATPHPHSLRSAILEGQKPLIISLWDSECQLWPFFVFFSSIDGEDLYAGHWVAIQVAQVHILLNAWTKQHKNSMLWTFQHFSKTSLFPYSQAEESTTCRWYISDFELYINGNFATCTVERDVNLSHPCIFWNDGSPLKTWLVNPNKVLLLRFQWFYVMTTRNLRWNVFKLSVSFRNKQ